MLIPMLHNVGRSEHGAILGTLADLAESGALQPAIDQEPYPLDEVKRAHYDSKWPGHGESGPRSFLLRES